MGKKPYPRWLARLLRRRRPEGGGDPARKSFVCDGDASKHAIAVAAATAAVAEAALAAAKAAAEVVRLTSRAGAGNDDVGWRRWSVDYTAAVKIQSAFRGYLARRALRALKGLVKLQALVRGHFVRKRSADMLRRMQAMVRLQARARASRIHGGQSTNHVKEEPESTRKLDKPHRSSSGKLNHKRCGSERPKPWTEDGSRVAYVDGEKGDKILEIDSWRPRLTLKPRRNYPSSEAASTMDYYYDTCNHRQSFAASDSLAKYAVSLNLNSRSPCNSESFISLRSLNLPPILDQDFSTQACSRPSSSHSKGRAMSPMTPARNECSRSFYHGGGHVGVYHPSYMANTESFRAKVRSQSAPRQRAEWLESRGSRKWLSAYDSDYRVSRSHPRGDLNP